MNFDPGNSHSDQSDAELHALLEAAERRRDLDLTQKRKIASIIIGVPTTIVILWVAGFLIHFKLTETESKTEPPSTGNLSDSPLFKNAMDALATPQMDIDGLNKKGASDTNKPGFVKKEDLEFAEKMMNFGETPKPKH
ncbi:MAG: hypothetical protein H8M99_13045 [Gloeobacteraceae cyanobacterium ES-bin-144]|nr:hypothetical protein [Verrucomicrobiales bacterium]